LICATLNDIQLVRNRSSFNPFSLNEPHYVFFYHHWIDFDYYWIGYDLHLLAYMAHGGCSDRCWFGRGGLLWMGLQKDIYR